MKIPKYKYVKNIIHAYKERAFQIRFPGGTSYAGDKNAVVIAPVFNSLGKVYFIVVPYQVGSGLDNNLDNTIENEKDLAARKLLDETGLIADNDDLIPILKVVVSNIFQNCGKHTKYYFILKKFGGGFINLDNCSFLNRETGTPFLVPGPLLVRELYKGHLNAFVEAINYLSSKLKKDDYLSIKKGIETRKRKDDRVIHLKNPK